MLYTSDTPQEESIEIKGLLERYLEEHPTHDLDDELSTSLMKIFGPEFFPENWKQWLLVEQAQSKFIHIFRAILIKYIDNNIQINTDEYLSALSDLLSNERWDGIIDDRKPMRDATMFLQKFRNISSQLVNTCTLRPRVQAIILRILGYQKRTPMKYQPLWVQLFCEIIDADIDRSRLPHIQNHISEKTLSQIRW
jgi:hypothetical protein